MVKGNPTTTRRVCLQEKVMLNINDFKSQVHKRDLERPNLFAVEFAIPEVMKNHLTTKQIDKGELLTLFCKNANLPGINLNVADNLRYGMGPNVKMPVRGNLNDINLTFLNDSAGMLHSFFVVWLSSIYRQHLLVANKNRPGENRAFLFEYKKNYQCDLKLTTYSGEPGKTGGSGVLQTLASVASAAAGVPFIGSLLGSRGGAIHELKRKRTYDFLKLYPTNISDIAFSSSSTDAVTEFNVGFTYQSFNVTVHGVKR